MVRTSRAAKAPTLPTTVGVKPHLVWVGPRADKDGTLYLRWWRGDNWGWKSLRFKLRSHPAAEHPALITKAYEAALDQYQRISGQRATPATRARAPVTLGSAWALLTDPKRGRYPTDNVYRRELATALRDAGRTLGKDFPLQAFDSARLREITRAHADRVMRRGGVGFRAAEVLGTRILTILRTLQGEGAVPETVPIPAGRAWHEELKKYCIEKRGKSLPPTHRPRYTLEEFRTLIRVAPQVDPRFGLMMALGAELRPVQVARARRSALALELGDFGEFTVFGRGKKAGTTIELTRQQQRAAATALAGYLAPLEARWRAAGADYLLFPGALGPQQRAHVDPPAEIHVGKSAIKKWVRAAEELAGIAHIAGRSWYGGRRAFVDGSLDEGISPDALENSGGWTDPRTPNLIYRDRGRAKSKRESRDVRSRVRGEDDDAGLDPLPDAADAP